MPDQESSALKPEVFGNAGEWKIERRPGIGWSLERGTTELVALDHLDDIRYEIRTTGVPLTYIPIAAVERLLELRREARAYEMLAKTPEEIAAAVRRLRELIPPSIAEDLRQPPAGRLEGAEIAGLDRGARPGRAVAYVLLEDGSRLPATETPIGKAAVLDALAELRGELVEPEGRSSRVVKALDCFAERFR